MNYYNEIDPYAAQWIRNLIDGKLIPRGHVDERSIEDVTPSDLAGYTQCHFFAGIAGWSLALAIAGVPSTTPIWTGSCPCQPFSTAGEGAGFADERHLWPAFHWLIQQCKPAVVAGEQVASKAAEPWIDLVRTDMEALGYAFGALAFPSASVGAPHIRDRTYWLGHTDDARLEGRGLHVFGRSNEQPVGANGLADRLADAEGKRWDGRQDTPRQIGWSGAETGGSTGQRPGPVNGHWRTADWLACRDGKWRPVEPGTFPLAYGVPSRVGRLRAYGNAINPYQAAEFIRSAGL